MFANDLRRAFDEDSRIRQPITQHIGPYRRQFATPGHVGSAIIHTLDLRRWDMRRHEVYDLPVMLLAHAGTPRCRAIYFVVRATNELAVS